MTLTPDLLSDEQSAQDSLASSTLNPTSQSPSRILVVEPHPTLRTVLVQRLRQDGHLAAAVRCPSCLSL